MKARLYMLVVILILSSIVVAMNYSYFFAQEVVGEIVEAKQIDQATMVLSGSNVPTNQIRSFGVAVKHGNTGEIYTASSEDRQWSVAKPGQCAIAKFYPYPPWNLEKAGTFHNARLITLCENCEVAKCKDQIAQNIDHK